MDSVLPQKSFSSQTPTDHERDISIWLDNHDDIFSDFDPRPYAERNISDDFLYELKKVSREDDFQVNELKLLIPEKNREREKEEIIIKRLHSLFRKNYSHYLQRKKLESRRAAVLALLGMVMMVGASYVSVHRSDNFFMHVLLVMLEPAGWFLVWIGLEDLIYLSRERKPELDFYTKMARSKIGFVSI